MAKSTTQLALDFSESEPASSTRTTTSTPSLAIDDVRIPSFDGYGEVYAAAARRAGRINASSVSDEEHQSLLLERQLLLDKKFAETITRKESNRLEYVRWSLDRIEDANHGWAMDVLEHSVSGYEQLSSDLKSLIDQLDNLQKKK
ncbi:hypothetical protein QA649_34435 [Bradyrhizobium sp. CB1717]|uniref:hypothetical protein n=1 Tax=Bradyrhizobium sp. CB1717 TaxID=3039154 RepID=UPI0024B0AE6A|nr:hypothetical protein [Bradyrhizobium sp. CB1717]WFU23141.1 hypothetical protein QA649_34435 [Bradyrhizobium sp. CB1717]